MLEYKVEYVRITDLQQRLNAFVIDGYSLHTATNAVGQQPPTMICVFEKKHKEAVKPKKQKLLD